MKDIQYDPQQDFYHLLGVAPDADTDALRQAYRQQAKRFHPDLNLDRVEWAKAQFQLLNDAYRVLNDPVSREAYDRQRRLYQPYSFYSAEQTRPTEPTERYAPPRQPPQSRPYNAYSTAQQPPHQRPKPPPASPPPQRIFKDQWLKRYGLGWLRPVYRRAVLLVESPYQYILAIVGVALLFNIVFIVSSFAGLESLAEPAASPTSTNVANIISATVSPSPQPSPTVAFVPHDTCTTPQVQIISPGSSFLLASDLPLTIRGRVAHPDMYTYSLVLVGRQGQGISQIQPAGALEKQPIADIGTLGELQPRYFSGGSGSYDLTLTVFDDAGNELIQCEVRYLFDADA